MLTARQALHVKPPPPSLRARHHAKPIKAERDRLMRRGKLQNLTLVSAAASSDKHPIQGKERRWEKNFLRLSFKVLCVGCSVKTSVHAAKALVKAAARSDKEGCPTL